MRISSSQPGATALALPFGLMSINPASGLSTAGANAGHAALPRSGAVALPTAMRESRQEHVLWTRLVIVGTAANLPDLDTKDS